MIASDIFTLSALVYTALAGSLSLPIQKHRTNSTHTRGNQLIQQLSEANAEGTLPVPIYWAYDAYFATIYVGSNGQKATPMVDTGSSDLWLMTPQNPFHGTFKGLDFIFDPSESTSFRNLSRPWSASYVDTSEAVGWLGSDTIKIGDATVNNLDFGVADFSNDSLAILGVSLVGEEAEQDYYTYPNLPVMLKNQGYIDHVAYSLYLNNRQSGEGEILFGGVDTTKYTGELGLVPMVQNLDLPFPSLSVVLDGISVHKSGNSCPLIDGKLAVILDSGTTYAGLFPEMVESLATAMGYTYDSEGGTYLGECSKDFGFDSFELDFSGIKLQVPPSLLASTWYDSSGNPAVTSDGSPLCWVGVQTTTEAGNLILGDIFLRNFYIAYDLENKEIGLAQSNFDQNGDSNIEDIVTGIPSATTAPGYSNTQVGASYQTYSNYDSCKA